MRAAGAMLAVTALAGCARPLPDPVPVGLMPLTVEQVLPDAVAASAVYERGGCYYYKTDAGFDLIETHAALDAQERC